LEKTNKNIDWNFILKLEGSKNVGYVPNAEGSDSGVTIASGFDLGARNESDLEGLPKTLAEKLLPYLGLKGPQAENVAKSLIVNDNEKNIINEFAKTKTMNRLKNRYKEATNRNFGDLPKHKATTIASVAFQYGNLESQTPNFWKQVTNDDWKGVTNNLQNFQDSYPTRRNIEANYFIKGESKQEKIIPGTMDTSQYQSNELDSVPELPGQITPTDPLNKVIAPEFPEDPSALDPVPIPPTPIEDGRKEMYSVGKKYDDPGIKGPLEDRAIPKYIPRHSISVNEKKKHIPYVPAENNKWPKVTPRTSHSPGYTAWDDLVNGFKVFSPYDEIASFVKKTGEKYAPYIAPGVPPLASGGINSEEEFPADPHYNRLEHDIVKNNPSIQAMTFGSQSEEETMFMISKITKEMDDFTKFKNSDSFLSTLGFVSAFATDPALLTGYKVIQFSRNAALFTSRWGRAISMSIAVNLPFEAIHSNEKQTYTGNYLLGSLAINAVVSASLASWGIKRLSGKFNRRKKEPKKVSNILTHRSDINQNKTIAVSDYTSSVDDLNDIKIIKIHDEVLNSSAYKEHVNKITNFSKALKDNSYIPTNLGIENIGLNPIMRRMNGLVPQEKILISMMHDLAAATWQNEKNIPTAYNADSIMQITVNAPLNKAIEKAETAYYDLKGLDTSNVAYSSFGNLRNSIIDNTNELQIKLGLKGSKTAEAIKLQSLFNQEIAMAMRQGDKHSIPQVQTGINAYREYFNYMDEMAHEAGLYKVQFTQRIEKLKESLLHTKDKKQIAKINEEIENLNNAMVHSNRKGPMQNNGISYVPRLYNHKAIEDNMVEFKNILMSGLDVKKYGGLAEVNAIAERQIAKILHNKGFINIDDSDDFINQAFALKQRGINVPDVQLAPFLINDIQIIAKHYARTVGMDIVLTNQFGDITMKGPLKNIADQYDELIKKAKTPAEKQKYIKAKKESEIDFIASRDRLRGTYGGSSDPHSWGARIPGVLKNIGIITNMGQAAISSLPDLGMVIMRHGLDDFMDGFKAIHSKNSVISRALKMMNKKELNSVAQGLEAVQGGRQMATADKGDLFSNRTKFEDVLHKSTNLMMLLNFLNPWNSYAKELVSWLVSQDIIKLALTKKPLSLKDLKKINMSVINLAMLKRIQKQVDLHGMKTELGHIANTEKWNDPKAVFAFRNALNLEITRTIVTPGSGDRALFTSRPLGTVIFQYKSFSQSFVQKVMIRGAQEKDINFATGIVSMILIGALVVQIKRLLNGQELEDDANELFYASILKSGVTGIFGDADNIASVLTNGQLTVARLAGIDPSQTSINRKLGVTGGPTVSYGLDLMKGNLRLPYEGLPAIDIAKGLTSDN
jgi:hypothetical protein